MANSHIEIHETVLEIVKEVPGIHDPQDPEIWDRKKSKQPSSYGVHLGERNEWQISSKLYLSNAGYEDWSYPDTVYVKCDVPEEAKKILEYMAHDQELFDGVFFNVKVGKRPNRKYGKGEPKSYEYTWDVITWGEKTLRPEKSSRSQKPFTPKYTQSPMVQETVNQGAVVTSVTPSVPTGFKDTLIDGTDGGYESRKPNDLDPTDINKQYQIAFAWNAKMIMDAVVSKSDQFETVEDMVDTVYTIAATKLPVLEDLKDFTKNIVLFEEQKLKEVVGEEHLQSIREEVNQPEITTNKPY